MIRKKAKTYTLTCSKCSRPFTVKALNQREATVKARALGWGGDCPGCKGNVS